MSRTTIDLDPTVLGQLRSRGRREGKSMGRLASELLAVALGEEAPPRSATFTWTAHRMQARIDLEDAEVVRRATETS